MSAEKRFTERDVVLAQRDAVVQACGALDALTPNGVMRHIHLWEGSLNLAARLYPLPKVTRPRVVTCAENPNIRFRVVAGEIEAQYADGPWDRLRVGDAPSMTTSRVRLLADLLASPTVEVDDGGSAT